MVHENLLGNKGVWHNINYNTHWMPIGLKKKKSKLVLWLYKTFFINVQKYIHKHRMNDILTSWLHVQAAWLYLEPIFSSEDICNQIPDEGQMFQTVDKHWWVFYCLVFLRAHMLTFTYILILIALTCSLLGFIQGLDQHRGCCLLLPSGLFWCC